MTPSGMYHSGLGASGMPSGMPYLPVYQPQQSQYNFFPFGASLPYCTPFGSSQAVHTTSPYPPTTSVDPMMNSPCTSMNSPYFQTDQHHMVPLDCPFSLAILSPRIRKCYGCGSDLTLADRSPPFNVVIRHPDYREYYNQSGELKKTTQLQNTYYHDVFIANTFSLMLV